MHTKIINNYNDCEESSLTSGNLPLGGDQVSAAAIMRENPRVISITIAKKILLDPLHSVDKGGSFYHVLHDSVTLAAETRPSASAVILCLCGEERERRRRKK